MSSTITAGSAEEDRAILATLYHATDGESWKKNDGWDTDANIGDWHGVSVDVDNRVVGLTLRYNNLSGEIPKELGNLQTVEVIYLYSNALTGEIPKELGGLPALEILHLGRNKLSGGIPKELGGLPALERLFLHYNTLSGGIPKELGGLPALKVLYLEGNRLRGGIPKELGGLPALERLVLHKNILSGEIPRELGNLQAAEDLNFGGNQLTGEIPTELGNLQAIRILSLGENQLTGGIPKKLGGLPALKMLYLEGNQLSGEIPKELGNLQAIQVLRLWGNRLTGEIPHELGNLQAAESIYLERNQLTGEIPTELGNLQAIQVLQLGENQLTGEIPKELGNLQAIRWLTLSGNRLTGNIPKELGKISTLDVLDLASNLLSGLGKVEDAWDLVQRFNVDNRRLCLDGNPWIMPPEAVVEEGLPAVKTYLEDVRTAEKAGVGIKTMQLIKVVLVGSSQAGKTSLMDSIVAGEAKATEGTPEEVSTIGIQLQRHPLKGVRVEFYDCAGQIDYKGMHQIFVSRRALYLLVWDVKKCQGKEDSTLDEVIEADVMPWLYALHLRAPDSTVILVANKCDGSLQTFSKTVQTVRTRVNERLAAWNDSRGIAGQQASRVSTLNVLAETSKVSCQDGVGLAELIDVVTAQSCTSMSVPPSWDLALVVLNAMRDKKAPLKAARDHISISSSSPTRHWEDGPPDVYIPKNALTRQWNKVLLDLTESDDVQSTALGRASVLNSDSALEGSLWISEFAGQLLRVGDGIFLDVGLLSEVLNPIVNHRLKEKVFMRSELNASRDTLLTTGVLTPDFARHLWGNVSLKHAAQLSSTRTTDQFESALFDVIIKLGLAFPLGRVPLPDDSDGSPSVVPQIGGISSQRDMLVWRWLPERLSDHREATRKTLVENRVDGAREVTLNWKFDSAGAPHGLMERLIALCHVIGEAEEALCWRTGAVFKSLRVTGGTQPPSYVVEIRYSNTERVLSVTMFGSLKSDRQWAALRFVASLMVNVSKEWPGALWAGWVKCAVHPEHRLHLKTPTEARTGAPLIPPTSVGCACRGDEGTVVGQTVARLGNVIDTKTGDPFEDLAEEEETEEEEVGEETRSRHDCCGFVFSMWRPHAWTTAVACWMAAFGMVAAAIKIDSSEPRRYVLVGCIVLLVLAGCAGVYVAFRQERAEQQPDVGVIEAAHIA